MTPALIGHFLGFTLALGGFAYIFLGLLWAIRVYKRWPRACAWLSIAIACLVGMVTVTNTDNTAEAVSGLLGVAVIVAFISWREKLFSRASAA